MVINRFYSCPSLLKSKALLYLSIVAALIIPRLHAQDKEPIDPDLFNDPHFREEHGLNAYTRPSIDSIFAQLDQLAPLPLNGVPFKVQKRMPLKREYLALELGFLICEGFLAVQSNDMKKVQSLATVLSKYANALGAGDRVKGHAANILAHSKRNNRAALKKELAATQLDVEKELILLQDVDLAHLISLGGWLRALDVSAHAVTREFTPKRAKLLYREDIADYYEYSLSSIKPQLKEKPDFKTLSASLTTLKQKMLLKEGQKPKPETIAAIGEVTKTMVKAALGRGK